MSDDLKSKVAKAGREILIAEGLVGLSAEAACRRAGVASSPFATRSDLVVAALDEHWSVLKPVFDAMFDRSRPPLERVRSYIDGAYASCSRAIFISRIKLPFMAKFCLFF